MVKHGKEFRSLYLSRMARTGYLKEEEMYIFAPNEPKYKFNIIGTGMMGLEHLRCTYLEGRSIINGIYDPNPGSIAIAKRALAQVNPKQELVVYESLEAACQDPDIDGIYICTPNISHIENIRVAVKSNKHIFLEKPMATSVEDAYEILQLSREYPKVFQIGLQYRYKAMYSEAIQEVFKTKSLGDIKMVHILEHRFPFLDKVKQWNKFNEYSGGTLVEKCCHYFDLLNLFSQSRPRQVYATGSMAVNFKTFEYNNRKSDILDNAIVSVEYENGVRAGFTLCMFAPQFYEEIMLCGDEGRLKAYENAHFLSTPDIKSILEIYRGEYSPSKISHPAYPKYIEQSGHSGATFFEHKFFIDSVEGKETSVATAEEGFWSIVVGAAAQKSIDTGNPVSIKDWLQELGIPM